MFLGLFPQNIHKLSGSIAENGSWGFGYRVAKHDRMLRTCVLGLFPQIIHELSGSFAENDVER